MILQVDTNTLVTFLQEKGYDAKVQNETGQIYFLLKVQGKDFPVFIRVFDESDLLQLLVFMPCQIKNGVHADLARFLHLINKDLDMPGFGMDESASVVFYRCMLPVSGKKVEATLFETFLKSLELITESIAPPVITIASGLLTFSELIQKMKESKTDKNPL